LYKLPIEELYPTAWLQEPLELAEPLSNLM